MVALDRFYCIEYKFQQNHNGILQMTNLQKGDAFLSLKIVFILANMAEPDEILPYTYFNILIYVVERKIFYLLQPGIKPRSLDLQANTLPSRCKSRLVSQGSRSVLYIPSPCYIHPLQFEIRPRISCYSNHVK